MWRDSWYEQSKCEYVRTVGDAMRFALRSVTKIGDSITEQTVTMWPYSSIARSVWGLAAFPNNEWPDSYVGMATCVTLNVGAYILAILVLTLVALNWDIVTDFLRIHVILALDVKYHVYDKHRRIEPDEQEDDGTRSDM